MGLQVPLAPHLLVLFFFRYCNFLFGETQTNKVDKTKQNSDTAMEAHENSSSDDTGPLLEHIQISAPYYCLLISRYIRSSLHICILYISKTMSHLLKKKNNLFLLLSKTD